MEATEKSNVWIGRLVGHQHRYRLDKLLGGGGMGDVYLAMDLALGKQVALKVLKASLSDQSDLRKRFDREIAVSAALGSEHIVQVLDHGVMPEGYPFYVMEFLKGESLGQRVRREKRLSPEQVVQIMVQVCEGLQLAHNGITLWHEEATYPEHIRVIHRDLKPDNIFLIPHVLLGDWVKILDFGIAKIYTEEMSTTTLTNVGSFLGTCRYAAPEQWRGDEHIDGRADIYALGVLIYQILSGTDPFGLHSESRTVNATSWLTAHAFTDPQPLRALPSCQALPYALDRVVMRCLAKEPQDRYSTVEELSLALKQAVGRTTEEQGISPEASRPTGSPEMAGVLETTLPSRQPFTRPEPVTGNAKTITTPTPIQSSQQIGAQAPTRLEVSPGAPATPTSPLSSEDTQGGGRPQWWGILGAAVALLMVSGVGLWMLNRGHGAIQQARSMAAQGDRLGAISLIEGISAADANFDTAQALISEWRMAEAREAANAGDFSTAIALASQVMPNQPNYATAQGLASEWLLAGARQAANSGDLTTAIAMASQISGDQGSFTTAQPLLADWQLQLALSHLEAGEWEKAQPLLTGISRDQPQFEPARALGQDLEQLQLAQTQARSGQFQEAIATAYQIRPEGALGAAAETLVCEQLAAILDQTFRMDVDAAANGGQPPQFGDYQISACTTPRIQIRSQILNLTDRSDDNLQLIAIAMAGLMWQNLPTEAYARLQSGEIQVEFVEADQTVARVFISRPALFTDGGADLLEQLQASTQIQRP